jgi:hypothetical protein
MKNNQNIASLASGICEGIYASRSCENSRSRASTNTLCSSGYTATCEQHTCMTKEETVFGLNLRASSKPRRSPRKSPKEVVRLTDGACFVNFFPAFKRAKRFCEQNLATSTLGVVATSSSLIANNRALFHSSRKACRYSRMVEGPSTRVSMNLLQTHRVKSLTGTIEVLL